MSAEFRYTKCQERMIEESWKNRDEAFALLGLIVAEWSSDPQSVACFDLRIVERAKYCVALKKHHDKELGFGL